MPIDERIVRRCKQWNGCSSFVRTLLATWMLPLKASPFAIPSPSSCYSLVHCSDAEFRNGFGLMARDAC
eukprot:5024717-Karenia_brevis.AAC.1